MTEVKPKIGGILLAAGGSRRLGRPKQLIEFQGKTLIRGATEALLDAGCSPIVVVVGHDAETLKQELSDLDVEIVENPEWEKGMSTSIRVGVSHIRDSEVEGVLVALCDQPLVDGDKLRKFVHEFSNNECIVTAEYNGIRGVPALFPRERFDDLANLEGDKGARDLIARFPSVGIALPEAALDIDTLADVEQLRLRDSSK